ncbi:unnamed protein product [Cyprideis torosa]|uniref:Uncharacterized protein n=1 Tax=Cyprideis torosa TaxID=163714 RepID=A0A7R8W3E9_9CRUS|nr:unnamed protein product [Cyprideis torosa]CAG0882941.1 unnamed protein product [Cyprideis torosa]
MSKANPVKKTNKDHSTNESKEEAPPTSSAANGNSAFPPFFKPGANRLEQVVTDEDKGFCCDWCETKFMLRSSLTNHYPYCRKNPAAISSLEALLSTESTGPTRKGAGPKPYVCDACGKVFRWPSELTNHQKAKHEPSCTFTCEVCGSGFRSQKRLVMHRVEHNDQLLQLLPKRSRKRMRPDDQTAPTTNHKGRRRLAPPSVPGSAHFLYEGLSDAEIPFALVSSRKQ